MEAQFFIIVSKYLSSIEKKRSQEYLLFALCFSSPITRSNSTFEAGEIG